MVVCSQSISPVSREQVRLSSYRVNFESHFNQLLHRSKHLNDLQFKICLTNMLAQWCAYEAKYHSEDFSIMQDMIKFDLWKDN